MLIFFILTAQGVDGSSNVPKKEVQASEILEKIKNGFQVSYEGVVINGDLDLGKLELADRYVTQIPYENNYLGVTENKKLITSPINLNDSIINGCVYFNNSIFEEEIHFNETEFNGPVSFAGSEFNKSADFERTHFNRAVSFAGCRFENARSFYNHAVQSITLTTIIRPVIDQNMHLLAVSEAGHGNIFNISQSQENYLKSLHAVSRVQIINGMSPNLTSFFSRPGIETLLWGSSHVAASFWTSIFNGTTTFENSDFKGNVFFENAKFNDMTTFGNSKFRETAGFSGCTFNGTVNFGGSQFKGIADFDSTKFNKIGKLVIHKSNMTRYLGYIGLNKSHDVWFWDSQMTADFWDDDFSGPTDFACSQFNGTAFFRKAQFHGKDTTFFRSKFNGIAYFGGAEFNGSVSFEASDFNGPTNFWATDLNIPNPCYILYCDINRPPDNWFWDRCLFANFLESRFNGTIDFSYSNFRGPSSFRQSRFCDNADFLSTNFSGSANFANVTFENTVKFNDAIFGQNTNFYGSQFDEGAFFLNTEFKDTLNLITTNYKHLYINYTNIHKVMYDESTYLLLVKNFNDLGLFEDADNCYLDYKAEHRNHLGGLILQKIDWMSEVLYGYGLRPMNPFYISCTIVVLFGFFWLTRGIGHIDNDGSRLEKIIDLLEPFIFSTALFLSGSKFLLDPPKLPKHMNKPRSLTRRMFYLEQLFGAIFLILFITALSRTIIRTI
ncbi:Pentapeptide repeats (9 copies) [uncultured archaeon]|nr:Pentapeptide repeats (9 copies) [uncultured archaeon]